MNTFKIVSATLGILTMPLSLFAQTGECGELATWTLKDHTLTISGTGAMTNYISPGSIYATFPTWYEYKDDIRKVVIEPGITTVGDFCFHEYRNLESVSLPEGLLKIGNYSFSKCSALLAIDIPETVEIIGDKQLNYSNFGFSFSGCSLLKEVTLPSNLKLIGGGAFNDCEMLERVNWNAVDCEADVIDPVNRFCGIFTGSYVQQVNFGADVKAVPSLAFNGLSSLSVINTKGSIDFVGYGAFAGTQWENLRNNNEVIYIDNAAYIFKFVDCYPDCGFGSASPEITILDGTRSITDGIFRDQHFLKKISIPSSVDRIGNKSFSGCDSLEAVVWNPVEIQDVEGYNAGQMFSPSLKNIEFGNSVEMLPAEFLKGCKGLKEIILPPNLKTIGKEAIYNCDSITVLTIPNSVESIGRLAVSYCKGLEKLTVGTGLKTFDYYFFLTGCDNLKTLEWNAIRTTEKKFDSYHGTDRCSAPVENFIVGNDVEYVPGQLFWNSTTLRNLELGSSVKEIGEAAFRGCKLLESVNLPQSLEIINEYAFNKSGVSSFLIPENVNVLGVWALGNSNLTEVISIPLEAPSNTSSLIDADSKFIAYVPDESNYKQSSWAQYSSHIKPMAVPLKQTFDVDEIGDGVVFTSNIPGCEIEKVDSSALDTTTGEHEGLVTLTFAGRYSFVAKVPFSYTVTDNSSVENIDASDCQGADVYRIDGTLILKGATQSDIANLPASIYIIRQGNSTKKLIVK